jgi:hypothetical protein
MTRQRLIPLVGPALVLVAMWAVAVVVTGSSADADQRITSAVDELAALETELEEIRRLEDPDVGEQLERRIAASEAAIPAIVDLSSVLDEISRLGEVHDVTVEQLAPTIGGDADSAAAVSATSADTSTVALALTGRGSYSAVMEFFEELGQGDRLVVVSYLQVAAIDGLETLLFDASVEVFTTASLASDDESGLDDLEGFDDAEVEVE